ncbi:MAG TPA: hypothetical protein VGC97_05465 [Pyrinomonadaceae bacterium]|jgi:hypothetical protein
MKRIISAFFLLVAPVVFANAADFSGSWSLDMKQSTNLPPYYANIKSHKLSIAQDKEHLTVAVAIDAGRAAADKFNFIYNLDGSDSMTETPIRTPDGLLNVPTVLNLKTGADGKLTINITRDIKLGDKSFKGITSEEWELGKDRKTLRIKRSDTFPDGRTATAEMIFVKV